MIYQDFEDYVKKEILRDRAVYAHGHFLELLKESMERYAKDLNTIDPSWYYEERTITMAKDVPVDLGRVLGFGGGSDQYGRDMPNIKVGNRRSFIYGIMKTFDTATQNTLITLKTSPNTYSSFTNVNPVTLMYSRRPIEPTGVASQPLDFNELHRYQVALLIKYFYFRHRDFPQEAQDIMLEYRSLMNTIVKHQTPDVQASEVGRGMTSHGYYSTWRR